MIPFHYQKFMAPILYAIFLMREIPFDRDGDFLMEKYENRYNADLANDWGNLVQRVLSMINKYRDGYVPEYSDKFKTPLLDEWRNLHTVYMESIEAEYDSFRFSFILSKLWQLIQLSNRFVEVQAPWKLYKKSKDSKELDNTLYSLVEMIRIANILVYPVMPAISAKIQSQLNIDYPFSLEEAAIWGRTQSNHKLGDIEPVFPKAQ